MSKAVVPPLVPNSKVLSRKRAGPSHIKRLTYCLGSLTTNCVSTSIATGINMKQPSEPLTYWL